MGGALAGLAACLLVLQYDIHPQIGLSVRPDHLPDLRARRPGQHDRRLRRRLHLRQFISVGGFFFHLEWGYVIAFAFFIVVMFIRPQGLFAGK